VTTIYALISTALRAMVPLTLAAIGEVITERAGVVNIGLEGIMLLSALGAAYVSYFTSSALLGILVAILVATAIGVAHGVLSVYLKGDQIVSGVGVNMFAYGIAVLVLIKTWGSYGQSPWLPSLRKIPAGPLGDISIFIPLTFIISILSYYFIFNTEAGLRLRAVGEKPEAADAMGINVFRVRFLATIIGSAYSGLAGGYLCIEYVSQFTKQMTAGRGFIALANVVFSNWNPILALVGGLIFGFFDGLATYLQIITMSPSMAFLLKTIPYLATLVIVSIAIGRVRPPASIGKPYSRE